MLLTGCVVGPTYRGPPNAPATPASFPHADAALTSTGAPAARWWLSLNDPQLDQLMQRALTASPTVEAARARLLEARAALREQRVDNLPNTGAAGSYVRTKNFTTLLGSGGSGGGALNLYALGFDASWEIDLFGARRHAIEGAAAALQGAAASLADVQVSLTAEVADAYIALRGAQQRLALSERNVQIEQQLIQLYEIRRRGGTASDLDVERIVSQVDATRATLAPLRAEVAVQLDRLALLTAQVPGSLEESLGTTAAAPAPPAHVPISDPASLLRRRPDIVMAERQLAERTAAVGEAVAAQFPKVTLLGEVGFASLAPGTLLSGNNFSYIFAPLLQWTPWDFGRNRARIGQADARRLEAEADYRQAVLAALEDADSSLSRYGEARAAVLDLARAQASAEHVYSLTEIRLRGGTASTTDVLDADTRRVQAELNYEQGLVELATDYVSLQKSLGLGWTAPSGPRLPD